MSGKKPQPARRPRKLIKWPGGKGRVVGRLVRLLPFHKVYVEPFGGSAALLFAKTPSPIEIYNDLDDELINLFRMVKDAESFEAFRRRVELTLYSRAEQAQAQASRGEGSAVDRAVNMYVAIMQGISGSGERGLGIGRTELRDGINAATHAYLRCVSMLPEVFERLRPVTIESDDFERVVERYDGKRSFFYCDPPYVMDTRRPGDSVRYSCEMDDADHKRLVSVLLKAEGKVLLSGYNNEIYKRLERAGWDKLSWSRPLEAMTIQQGKKRPRRVEVVWANYDLPRGEYDGVGVE